jgi:hypothetical protein
VALLAQWLGHTSPLDTYWYLSASAELMATVSDRMASHHRGGLR